MNKEDQRIQFRYRSIGFGARVYVLAASPRLVEFRRRRLRWFFVPSSDALKAQKPANFANLSKNSI